MLEMTDTRCGICGVENYRSYLKFRDGNEQIVICRGCNTYRVFPYSNIDYSEQEFYCEHYIRNEKLFRGFAKSLLEVALRHKKNGRFLDIGCAVGFLLEEARSSGFKAEGVELNKKATELVRSKGFDVKLCALHECGYSESSFDVISLNHILEHVIEPNEFLKSIRGILKNTGIIIIGVPNHDSLVAKLYKSKWYGWGVPEHIWHFDRVSMQNLLSKNGFQIKEVIQNNQYYPFSKSFRKNLMALVALLADKVGVGDQLIVVAEKNRN